MTASSLTAAQLAQRVVLVAEALDAMGAPLAYLSVTPYGRVQVQFPSGVDFWASVVAERFGLPHTTHHVMDDHQFDSWDGAWADFTVTVIGQDSRRWVSETASVFCDAEFGRDGDHAKWCGEKAWQSREAMAVLQRRITEGIEQELAEDGHRQAVSA